MPRRKRPAEPAEAIEVSATETRPDHDPEDLEAALGELEPGSVFQVYRQAPPHAKGWLEDVELSQEDLPGLRQHIARTWGGGKYKIQAIHRRDSGKMRFGRACAVFVIAGEPLYNGRRYLPGGQIENEPQAVAPKPVVMQQQPPATSGLDAGQLLGQLLPLVLDRNKTGDLDLVSLVGTLQQTLRGGAEVDPFGQVERTLSLLTKLRETFGDREPEPERDRGFGGLSDLLGGDGGGLEKLLLFKLLGNDQPRPPAPWTQPPPYPPTMQEQPPPPPPPGWRWTGSSWARTEEGPAAETPVTSAPSSSTTDDPKPGEDQEEDDAPLTAAEIAAEITDRSPAEQEKLIREILDSIGVSADYAIDAVDRAGQTFPGAAVRLPKE